MITMMMIIIIIIIIQPEKNIITNFKSIHRNKTVFRQFIETRVFTVFLAGLSYCR
jgi:hypothetical protein